MAQREVGLKFAQVGGGAVNSYVAGGLPWSQGDLTRLGVSATVRYTQSEPRPTITIRQHFASDGKALSDQQAALVADVWFPATGGMS
jgi:hypothetical protein